MKSSLKSQLSLNSSPFPQTWVKQCLLLHQHAIAKPSLVTPVKAKVPYRSKKIIDRQSTEFRRKQISKEKTLFFKKELYYFSIRVYIQYYFVLVSDVHYSGYMFPHISSTHLAPHIIITILLTTFPMRKFSIICIFCFSLYIF